MEQIHAPLTDDEREVATIVGLALFRSLPGERQERLCREIAGALEDVERAAREEPCR